MSAMIKNFSLSRMQTFGQWLIVLFIIMSSSMYIWQVNEFRDESQRLKTERGQYVLERTTTSLNFLISELKRDVLLLSQSNHNRIASLVADPENDSEHSALINDLKDVYPEVFSSTIADSSGQVLIEDFDGFVQQQCTDDIANFVTSEKRPEIYIHPNPYQYHFDLMTKILVEDKYYIFFISFNTSLISKVLKNNVSPGYKILLVNRDIDGLIEVTVEGSRNKLDGINFLTNSEIESVIGEIEIPETRWNLLLFEDTVDETGKLKLLHSSHLWPIIIFNLICFFSLTMLQLMKRRIKSQERLLDERAHALAYNRERLTAVFNSVLDGMVTIDMNATITDFNPAAMKMFGYSFKEVLGKNVKMLMPEPYHKEHDGYIKSYLGTGVEKIIGSTRKVTGLKKNGEEFPIELSVSVIRYLDNIEFVGVVRDATSKTQIEKMKKEFISTVSHEMRTPLTSIRGSLGLIIGGAFGQVDVKIRNMVEIAVTNTDRMIRMINDILDIDRIESGNMFFHFKNSSLKKVVSESISNVRGIADEKKIEIEFHCLNDDTIMKADGDRLIQAVVNLLSNAIKYSQPESTVLVLLDCNEGSCTLSIKDTGIGIPEKDQEIVFDKFTQVDSSDTRNIGGSGLGLSIVKSIITAHHGTITLESKVGFGSTFMINLPR